MEPNFETMSDAELRALALEQLSQPRDEQGRFVTQPTPEAEAPVETEVVEESDDPEEEIVYRKVIDLGDGSGTQVFEASSMEELVEKLAKAQEHATRKIREQAQQLKTTPVLPVPEMTQEQRWLLTQRVQTEPEKVFAEYARDIFKKEYGPKIEEIESHYKAVQSESAAQEWVDKTPDYLANARNGERMKRYLQTYKLDQNAENLQKAFEDLSASGLLEAKATATPETDAEPEVTPAPVKRIVEPTVTTTVRRKVVGGISTKRSAPVEASTPKLTEDELYKMPMDELEQLMYRHNRS